MSKRLVRYVLALAIVAVAIVGEKVLTAEAEQTFGDRCQCYWGYHGTWEDIDGVPVCWKSDCWVPI